MATCEPCDQQTEEEKDWEKCCDAKTDDAEESRIFRLSKVMCGRMVHWHVHSGIPIGSTSVFSISFTLRKNPVAIWVTTVDRKQFGRMGDRK